MTAAPPRVDEDSSIARAGEKLVEQLLKVGLNGFGPFKSAEESAAEALKGRTPEEAVKALVRNHCAIAGAQGFITNVGGLVTLPIALPANIGAAYLVQTHLAGAIAAVHGHDLDAEAVRSAILLCLVGNAGTEVVKRFGIKVSSKLTITMIERIPIEVIRRINKRVGFMLIAKFGTKRSVVTLAKWVPMVGGFIGGGVDTAATWAVGAYAHRAFQRSDGEPVGGAGAV
ncbi:EcsC family protein [Modestobacter muralis]|uniref:EcsC family protein n=1 Tax=Modestobacter muralis TaxID=1608614 RepID=A0A6P0EPD3_9ACTN|nr:EcsC family protein [Modestobacter muralis]NEK92715.1 EcsC family protein [Modestobacter muralis]NEN49482.1 EcsC family protein [Modestobacter muralis]